MTHRAPAFALIALAVSIATPAAAGKKPKKADAEEPAPAGPRRDPQGVKGISPFWESIKKGDDALVAKDLAGAKSAYQDAIKSEPQNAMGHYRMGEAELQQGNLKEAEASWQTASRFAGQNAALKAKVLFVLADVSERLRALDEATNRWNGYEDHAKANATAKTYPQTPPDRKKRIEDWKKLETEYGAVKDRIKQRLAEADKKAASDAQSSGNR